MTVPAAARQASSAQGWRLFNKKGIPWFDYLLIIGIMMAPMTELRLWKIGPSELLCFIWSTRYLGRFMNTRMDNLLTRFWLAFYLTLLAGTVYCLFRYPSESSGLNGLTTWFFMMYISFGAYYGMKDRRREEVLAVMEKAGLFSLVCFALMLVYTATVSQYLFGIRLWYAGRRFAGGGANPHQMAILSLCLVFSSLYFLARVPLTRRKRLLHALLVGFFTYVLFLTRSTTALMALFTSAALYLLLLVIRHKQAVRERQAVTIALLSLMTLVVVFGFAWFFQKFMDWVAKDPNGLHRFELFAYVRDPLMKSPLFGLGDGTHSNAGISEFHNTYLEIIGMTGLIGVVIFIIFTIRLIGALSVDRFLWALPFALYIYGLAGFGLRRLPNWVFTAFMLALADQLRQRKPAPAPRALRAGEDLRAHG